jgi:hypothetical protein
MDFVVDIVFLQTVCKNGALGAPIEATSAVIGV